MSQTADLWTMNINVLFLMSALLPGMAFEKEETVEKELDVLIDNGKKNVREEE